MNVRGVELSVSAGNLTVAPGVLARLVSSALAEVPGVARQGRPPQAQPPGTMTCDGVALRPSDDGAAVDCYLIAQPGVDLVELGAAVQCTTVLVARELAGVALREVNVFIQDVEAGLG